LRTLFLQLGRGAATLGTLLSRLVNIQPELHSRFKVNCNINDYIEFAPVTGSYTADLVNTAIHNIRKFEQTEWFFRAFAKIVLLIL
jgi:hypothetical protein